MTKKGITFTRRFSHLIPLICAWRFCQRFPIPCGWGQRVGNHPSQQENPQDFCDNLKSNESSLRKNERSEFLWQSIFKFLDCFDLGKCPNLAKTNFKFCDLDCFDLLQKSRNDRVGGIVITIRHRFARFTFCFVIARFCGSRIVVIHSLHHF